MTDVRRTGAEDDPSTRPAVAGLRVLPPTAAPAPTWLPGAGQVQLAARVTLVVLGAGLLGVGVHVLRTARALLRH